jgi:subfamily B ATP-binding cassette protein HlyB/CyaB
MVIPASDSGLAAVVMLLRLHGVPVELEQIRHRMGTGVIGESEIVRCSRQFGLKARAVKSSWGRLSRTPLPAIAILRDGSFLLLGNVAGTKVLVQRHRDPRC